MDTAERWKRAAQPLALFAALAAALAGSGMLSGCGLQAAPQPPSLDLPDPVTDLSASRTGDTVSLTWTMPQRDTDKVLLKKEITVRVCRRERSTDWCVTAGTLLLRPASTGTFLETLPPALAAGSPRALNYSVELINKRSRSAGLSNTATVVAGQAPAAVAGLTAEMRKDGAILRWTPGPPEPFATMVRLHRTLLTPPAAKAQHKPQNEQQNTPAQGLLTPPAEPAEQNLLVEAGGIRGRAIDKEIRFGGSYEYRAQRVARLTVNGKTLELAGPLSEPVRIEASDVFPPAVPTGLAAIALPAEAGAGQNSAPSIDLSWQPDTEADLAGYIVYRREGSGTWRRISPAQPVVGPGFHDADVQAGHTYEYSVSAIGQNGHESARSDPAEETVPNP
jgi:hypothetical protein